MFMKKAFHIILILISLKSFGQEVLVSSVVTPDFRFGGRLRNESFVKFRDLFTTKRSQRLRLIELSIVAVVLYIMVDAYISSKKINRIKVNQLTIPKSTYMRMVVDWCNKNLGNGKIFNPIIIVRYYKHKKCHGEYDVSSNRLVVYLNNHENLLELTNTTIHEFVHVRQSLDKKMMKKYNQYHQDVGYLQNPYEIESHEISSKYEVECMTHILEQLQPHCLA